MPIPTDTLTDLLASIETFVITKQQRLEKKYLNNYFVLYKRDGYISEPQYYLKVFKIEPIVHNAKVVFNIRYRTGNGIEAYIPSTKIRFWTPIPTLKAIIELGHEIP